MSRIKTDLRAAAELDMFLDEHFYPALLSGKRYWAERVFDLERQFKGIDVVIWPTSRSAGKRPLNIDEKAQLYYLDRSLPTFAFELGFMKDGEHRTGWFVNDGLLTDRYLLLFPAASNSDLETITRKDFTEVEATMIDKKALKSFLSSKGLDDATLIAQEQRLRRSGRPGRSPSGIEGIHYSVSDPERYEEAPINLVISREILEKLAVANYIIKKDGVYLKGSDKPHKDPLHHELIRPADDELPEWKPIVKKAKSEEPVKYSFLTSDRTVLDNGAYIDGLLSKGIKVLAFCDEQAKRRIEEGKEAFISAGLLRVFVPTGRVPTLTIIDGDLSKDRKGLEELSKCAPAFNHEQYIVEHAPIDKDLIIEAGAGTGKTTVMIDRVMFLMNTVPDFRFDEIAMITFTNESTQHMKHKIEDALTARYGAVPSIRNLQLMESFNDIQISTIHSFSRKLIGELGGSIGYGDSVRLRSMKYEKQELIKEVLDERFRAVRATRVDASIGAKLHEMSNLIMEFWSKLDNIGLTDEEIDSLDWGGCSDGGSEAMHLALSSAFKELAYRYSDLKMTEDSIAVEDLIREIRKVLIAGKDIGLKSRPLRYLFVDEFQDTDNSQISTIVWLVRRYGIRLFAVGDVKQSIYRFRGAVETAFEKLKRSLEESIGETPAVYKLIRNYRTSEDVMTETDAVFRKLEKHHLLEYGSSLIAQKHLTGRFEMSSVIRAQSIPSELPDKLRAALEDCERYAAENGTEGSPSQHVTVLARANYQINEVGAICREEKIPCYIQREGTLYTSRAATDLCAMLRAYSHPTSAAALFDLIYSPYTAAQDDTSALAKYEAGSARQVEHLRSILRDHGFDGYLQMFRTRPVLTVISEIISDPELLSRYAQERWSELEEWEENARDAQLDIDCKQYIADLEKIMEDLRKDFSGEIASLISVYERLKLAIATDRSSDEPDISGVGGPGCIYGMTVHKAKGLEFDTVIIPYTDKPFRRDCQTEILLDESSSPMKVGWCRVVWKDQYKTEVEDLRHNDYYNDLATKEDADTAREEARLLYVAMTRAIRNLEIIVPLKHKANTWASLLGG